MSDIIRKPSLEFPLGDSSSSALSLNRDSRRKELQRITSENMGILKRIERVQPMYDHVRWEQEFRRTRKFMQNRCELPLVLNSSASSLLPQTEHGSHSSRAPSDASNDSPDCEPDNFTSHVARRIVLKTGHRLDDKFYLIEISTDGGSLWIEATDSTGEVRLTKHMCEEEHEKLFQSINGDYKQIIERLGVSRGNLKLTIL